jgi:hypothetical protein
VDLCTRLGAAVRTTAAGVIAALDCDGRRSGGPGLSSGPVSPSSESPAPLKLSSFGPNVGGLGAFRQQLRARLKETGDAWRASIEAIGHAALAEIVFDAPGLDDAARAIRVLAHFGFRESDEARAEPVETFVHEALGWSGPPAGARERRIAQGLEDLGLVRRNLRRLREEKAVKEYENGEKPRDDAARTLVTFFRRNLDEQDAIIDYMTARLDDDALHDVDADRQWLERQFLWTAWRDPPYPLRWYRGEERLDPNAIDEWHHRVLDLEVMLGHELGEAFDRGDKEAFYRGLHARIPPTQAFDDLDGGASVLPRLGARSDIFRELRDLHADRRWYGFTALALTQVEGLVAEVLEIHGAAARPHAALPEKVQALRALDDSLERSLDYFEHRLPRIRNQLLHGAHPEPLRGPKRELVAYDLLHDLRFIVNWLLARDVPAVKLRVALKKGAIDGIKNVDDAFVLVDALEQLGSRERRKAVAGSRQAEEDAQTIRDVEEAMRRALAKPGIGDAAIKAATQLNADVEQIRDRLRSETDSKSSPFDLASENDRAKQPDDALLDAAADVFEALDDDGVLERRDAVLAATARLLPDGAGDAVRDVLRQGSRLRHNYRALRSAVRARLARTEARDDGPPVPVGVAAPR